jgi:hypothetical protein
MPATLRVFQDRRKLSATVSTTSRFIHSTQTVPILGEHRRHLSRTADRRLAILAQPALFIHTSGAIAEA